MDKFFRIATEGATIDGRVISAKHIKEMARNYDPDKYQARIWVEHMRSIMPDGVFPAVGDVLALKTGKNDEGKMVLMARIAPTAELLRINQEKQKLFTSVELDPDFAGTGEAYLVGLAITDSPASLGTERLMFNALSRDESHLFSVYSDFDPDFEENEEKETGIMAYVKGLLSKHSQDQSKSTEKRLSSFYRDVCKALEQVVTDYTARDARRGVEALSIKESLDELRNDFEALKKELDATPAGEESKWFARPLATGQIVPAEYETDC